MVKSEMGFVNNNSIVPVRFSSEKERMVMAGIRMMKIIGLIPKKGFKSAVPPSKIFVSYENTHKKRLFKIKKMEIKMYPIIDPKKLRNSFKYNAFIKSTAD